MRRGGAGTNTLYFDDERLDVLLRDTSLVAFDMNGLIVDDESLQHRAVNRALATKGVTIDEKHWIRECVGHRATDYLPRILHMRGVGHTARDVETLVERKNRFYRDLLSRNSRSLARPGVMDLLDALHSLTKVLALATSAHPAETRIILGPDGLDILDRFSHIVTGVEEERSKPHPEIYTLLAARAGVDAARCLVFEDSGLGTDAAHGAGMPCVAVPNRYTRSQNFERAVYVLDNLTRHAKIIDRST
jgi:HAD superfamily hydrolase (TIGR01509 family)